MMNASTLQVTTPSDREIVMKRVFNAPRRLVFDAWTKPELIRRWLGVRAGWSMVVCEVDLKVGGTYRYVWRGPDGDGHGRRLPRGRATGAPRLHRAVRPAVVRRRGRRHAGHGRAGCQDHGHDDRAVRIAQGP